MFQISNRFLFGCPLNYGRIKMLELGLWCVNHTKDSPDPNSFFYTHLGLIITLYLRSLRIAPHIIRIQFYLGVFTLNIGMVIRQYQITATRFCFKILEIYRVQKLFSIVSLPLNNELSHKIIHKKHTGAIKIDLLNMSRQTVSVLYHNYLWASNDAAAIPFCFSAGLFISSSIFLCICILLLFLALLHRS